MCRGRKPLTVRKCVKCNEVLPITYFKYRQYKTYGVYALRCLSCSGTSRISIKGMSRCRSCKELVLKEELVSFKCPICCNKPRKIRTSHIYKNDVERKLLLNEAARKYRKSGKGKIAQDRYNHSEKGIKNHLKYYATKKGKSCYNKNHKLYIKRHPDVIKKCAKAVYEKRVGEMWFSYMKSLYLRNCRHHNVTPLEYTNEMWYIDKAILQTKREVKKIQKQLKLNQNENK